MNSGFRANGEDTPRMDEFSFIKDCLSPLAGPQGLSLSDDVAIFTPMPGYDLVLSMDTIVEGVHFPVGQFDAALAQKLLRVNISDIVAKGADPIGYLLALSIPQQIDTAQFQAFCRGLQDDQRRYELSLWGGDTTRGGERVNLSATIIGQTPKGTVVRRTGAQPGDLVCVTGTIGDGYLGLLASINGSDCDPDDRQFLLHAYQCPNPPFAGRHVIRDNARAAIDVSDGLLADARHIALASDVKILIKLEKIPLSEAGQHWLARQDDVQNAMLKLATGGDDYQTLMTVKPENLAKAVRDFANCGIELHPIGRVEKLTKGVETELLAASYDGHVVQISQAGYTHF